MKLQHGLEAVLKPIEGKLVHLVNRYGPHEASAILGVLIEDAMQLDGYVESNEFENVPQDC